MSTTKSLIKALELRGMSQQALADEFETTKSYINGFCRGVNVPSIQQARHMARILDMKYSEFIALGESDIGNIPQTETTIKGTAK